MTINVLGEAAVRGVDEQPFRVKFYCAIVRSFWPSQIWMGSTVDLSRFTQMGKRIVESLSLSRDLAQDTLRRVEPEFRAPA
jgi:hypothetical protein